MANIRQLRRTLGVTQQQLADYLSISRAQLAMAETGQRVLPIELNLKLDLFERYLNGSNTSYVSAELQQHTEKARNILTAHVKKYTALADRATQKLERMREQYGISLQVLRATDLMLRRLPAGADGKKERLWLDLLQDTTRRKMNRCGLHMQTKLQLEADGFSFHATHAGKLML